MIEVTPTEDQIKEAKLKARDTIGLQGSISRGAGSIIGALGEIIVRDYLGYIHANTPHYDLYTSDGTRIDVKTKHCNTTPKSFYECSIAAHGTKQNCDEYIFVRSLVSLQKMWILGRIPKDEYYTKAVRHKKGEVDESNGFTFKSDCYNLEISELWPIQKHNYSTSA